MYHYRKQEQHLSFIDCEGLRAARPSSQDAAAVLLGQMWLML